jgi:hypothetical protein
LTLDNPYSVADTLLEEVQAPLDPDSLELATAMRRRYINHETSIRQFGRLYKLIGAALAGLAGLLLFLSVVFGIRGGNVRIELLMAFLAVVISPILIITGRRTQDLQTSGRGMATLLGIVGMLFVPVGTILGAYQLYLLWSRPGVFVYSQEYRRVIALTPGVRSYTSPAVWSTLISIAVAIIVTVLWLARQ